MIDYGSAEFLGDSKYKINQHNIGTRYWIPPEVKPWFNEGNGSYISYGADMWMIGNVIHYMMMGEQIYKLTENQIEECKVSRFDFWGNGKGPIDYWYDEKLLGEDKYDMDSDKNGGEIELRKHMIQLMYNDITSMELCSLLHDLFQYDPRKRPKCVDVLNHAWFET